MLQRSYNLKLSTLVKQYKFPYKNILLIHNIKLHKNMVIISIQIFFPHTLQLNCQYKTTEHESKVSNKFK